MVNDNCGVSDELGVALGRGRSVQEFVPIAGKVYLELLDEIG